MADELDREGKAQAAAAHYNSFLGRLRGNRRRIDLRLTKSSPLCCAWQIARRIHRRSDLAVKSYHLAEKLAAQTGQAKLESVADVNEAALQSKTGKLTEALRLYQQALRLDDSTADASASAHDWFAYGRFLDDAGFPVRLAFACIREIGLTDAIASQSNGSGRMPPRDRNMRSVSVRRPRQLRRDPESALQEALALRR